VSSERWRTAAAPAVRRYYDTSEPARWHAATTPAVRHLTTPQRISRFSLKQPPGFPCCGMASAQGFLSRWSLEPMAMARGKLTVAFSPSGSGLSRCYCRQASTSATWYGGPVSAPGGSRRTTALLHAPCSSKRAPVLPLRQGVKPASALGHSHSKPMNLFPCYLSMGQFLCWEEPCKLPR